MLFQLFDHGVVCLQACVPYDILRILPVFYRHHPADVRIPLPLRILVKIALICSKRRRSVFIKHESFESISHAQLRDDRIDAVIVVDAEDALRSRHVVEVPYRRRCQPRFYRFSLRDECLDLETRDLTIASIREFISTVFLFDTVLPVLVFPCRMDLRV